jgi:lysozyme
MNKWIIYLWVFIILLYLDNSIKENNNEIIKIIENYSHQIFVVNDAKTSKEGINLIKNHEKLNLEAYCISDGMITIGYGHSNPIKTSKYKIGDIITEEEANELFKKDLKRKEDGIKRMISQWEEQGYSIEITQSMFDAMVSMAFNIGISGLRTTNFVQYLKNNDYFTAAELIKTTKINNKFPGLINRRKEEYNLFIKDIS